jgi:ABC-type oligopeptide transport system substrate-binding subunit
MGILRSVLAGVIAGALLLSACSAPPETPSDPEPSPGQAAPPAPGPADVRRGGTLRVGLSLDPYTLDPRFLADEQGQLIADALFDPLVRLDEHFEVLPGAAERWELSEDGRELTFHLREAAFHDGTPVTADDFVRTFARIADGGASPPSFLAYLLEPVEGFAAAQAAGQAPLAGVEALDERTLRIRLSIPDRSFLTTLADPSLVPVPVAADDDPDAFAEQPVGNGPFRMTEPRERDAFLRLRRNAEHHSPPLLDEVLLQIYQEDPTRDRQWDDLLDGQLQVAEVPSERRDEAIERFGRADDGASGPGLVEGLTSAVYLYGFDVTQSPFDLPELRRAISLAIDREALAQDVMLGSRVPATAVIPPSLPGAQAGACGYCRHDPEAARVQFELARQRLLAEAGDGADPVAADDEGTTAAGQQDVADRAGDGSEQGTEEATGQGAGEAAGQGAGEATGQGAGEATGQGAGERPGEEATVEAADGGSEAAAQQGAAQQGTEESRAGLEDVGSADVSPVLERLTLTHNRGRTHAAIAQRMAADIEDALGVEVDLDARELEPFLQAVSAGQVSVFRLGWDPAEPQPGSYLRPLFHSSQIGVDNLMRYASDDVDRYLDEARTAAFPTLAEAWYRQAERRVLEDLPAMPLLWYRHQRVIAPEVRDLRITALGRMSFAEAWLDTGQTVSDR